MTNVQSVLQKIRDPATRRSMLHYFFISSSTAEVIAFTPV